MVEMVKDLREHDLLTRLQRFCTAEIIGDDAAVLSLGGEDNLVVTTDVLVDGVHFSDRTTSPEDAGWRAVAANLSDLAAMGASPIGITVGLALPSKTTLAWVEGLYRGMAACLERYKTPLVGGDICRSSVVSVAITAFGRVGEGVILRSLARVGDAIVATGIHGASRGGLELLLHPEIELDSADRAALIQAHQRPRPRLDVLPCLRAILPHGRVAGMDSSDGLADAIVQICRASGVGAKLDYACLPLADAVVRWLGEEQAIEWALYGGEDFELVLCLPIEAARQLGDRLGENAFIVGEIISEKTVILEDTQGIKPKRTLTMSEGFQHF